MIRLGLRLALRSGREALGRVLVTAAAVGLGVGLLLFALAGGNGLNAQTLRGAWLDTGAQPYQPQQPQQPAGRTNASAGSSSHRLWWLLTVDQYGTQAIDRVDVAPAGSGVAPTPPGIPHLPGPGQFYASPALESLFRSVPASELRERYPGRLIGTIGAAALPSPSSLVVVVGHTAHQLSQTPGATEVSAIERTASSCTNCASGVGSGPVLQWVLAGGAVALLLPVLILIATASRLSATRREERFAAMRLVGAVPHQISVISAVEATVASVAGVAAGFVLFFAFRPLLYHVPFTGQPLAAGDLRLTWIDVLLVVVGVPIAAAVSSRLALRRVQISPLGVTRRTTAASPRVFRIIPLLGGIGLLAYFASVGKPGSSGGQIMELLAGVVLLVVGLVLAGPWFTTAGSRLIARRANRPTTLIAGRRLLDNPKAAFRFISGLVIALFITSAAIGALSSIASAASQTGGSNAGRDTLADLFCSYSQSNCPRSLEVPSVPAAALARLRAVPGVRAVTVIHQTQSFTRQNGGFGLVECNQLATTTAIGHCARGASTATVGYFLSNLLGHSSHAATTIWPPSRLSAAAVARLPVDAVVVATDSSAGAIERTRTALERAFPFQGTAVLVNAFDPQTARLVAMVQDMTDVVIIASLIIAACSLAVNLAGGLAERRRPFSLLRLSGAPTRVLHRVVALEAAVPLVFIAAISILVGLVAAALFLRSQVDLTFRIPGVSYWVTVAGGLAASLGIIASTFPLLDRVTGPEAARND